MKNEKTKKRILFAVEIVLAVVIALNIVTILLSMTDLRDRLGWIPFAAVSAEDDTMAPEINRGDMVIVYEAPYASLKVGDDVTFIGTDGLVTHRIVGVKNGEYVTHGVANKSYDHYTVTEKHYCGHAILVVPLAGYVLSALCSPVMLAALCALAVIVFVGIPFVAHLYGRKKAEKTEKEPKKAFAWRQSLLVCLSLISIVLCLPHMTEAKYIGRVNLVEFVWAEPLYFTSNYLSEEGNTYSIQGWNGEKYPLSLQIRNHSNSLLFNKDNESINYAFGIKKYSGGELSDQYDVTITAADGVEEFTGNFTYPEAWNAESGIVKGKAYSIAGGEKLTDSFNISIEPTTAEGALPAKTNIHFEIYVVTNEDQTYFMELIGTFKLSVAEHSEFLGTKEISDLPTMVNISQTTNLINDGTSEKIVMFSWNPSKLYINEFESTAFNIIQNYPAKYYNKDLGLLYMSMQAYSKVNLEFFKRVDFDADENTVRVQVVDSIPELADQTAPPAVTTAAPEGGDPVTP